LARKKTTTLTEGELRMMEVVWTLGKASVRDVTDQLRGKDAIAYNTVQTMLRILEDKGYLQHQKQGRSFIYHPLVGRQQARNAALRHLLKRFFDDSPQALVANLLQNENMDMAELEQLKALIEQSEQDQNNA
jgi:predicted transcriptional regulator